MQPRSRSKKASPAPAESLPPPPPAMPAEEVLRIEYEPLSFLLEAVWEGNPKAHNLEELDKSMKRFGFTSPPTRDEGTGKLVVGHGRITNVALRKEKGLERPRRVLLREQVPPGALMVLPGRKLPEDEWYLPVIRGLTFESAQEAEAYLLAENQITMMAGWDDELLAPMLKRHQEQDDGLEGLGWTSEQVAELVANVAELTAGATETQTGGGSNGGGPVAAAPQEFREFDAGQKQTVPCPSCGFHVVIPE